MATSLKYPPFKPKKNEAGQRFASASCKGPPPYLIASTAWSKLPPLTHLPLIDVALDNGSRLCTWIPIGIESPLDASSMVTAHQMHVLVPQWLISEHQCLGTLLYCTFYSAASILSYNALGLSFIPILFEHFSNLSIPPIRISQPELFPVTDWDHLQHFSYDNNMVPDSHESTLWGIT